MITLKTIRYVRINLGKEEKHLYAENPQNIAEST
jgi:hypothetical protein